MRARSIVAVTFLVALVVFAVVQDRITADGARRYVALQRDALAGRGNRVTIEDVMRPAIDRSVRVGLLAAGGVAAIGGLIAWRRR
jgi:ABC-type Fe3+ transport system permease subunit